MQNFDPMNPGGITNPGQNNWMQALDFSSNASVPSQQGQVGGNNGLMDRLNGLLGGSGLGMNIPTMQLGIGGIGAINSIFQGNRANKLAKQNFNLARDVTNTNLNNQIKSYNTALEDRIGSRAVMEGRDKDYVDSYIEKNRLSR